MRKSAFHLPRPFLAVLICIALSSAQSGIAQQRRALPTHLAAPATEPAVAPVQTEQSIRFGLTLPLRNRAALEARLQEQRDPSSPHYRQYLTAQQFLQQYGPTQADYDSVVAFAKSQGFTVTHTYANRLLVNVSGSATNINKTFAVKMQVHQRTAQTGKYYAPDVEPIGLPSFCVAASSCDAAAAALSAVTASRRRPAAMACAQ
jgi:subtilase family serine protease